MKRPRVFFSLLVLFIAFSLVAFFTYGEYEGAVRSAEHSCLASIASRITYKIRDGKVLKIEKLRGTDWKVLNDTEVDKLFGSIVKSESLDCYRFPNYRLGRTDNGTRLTVRVKEVEEEFVIEVISVNGVSSIWRGE